MALVSIIIPVVRINNYINELVDKILSMSFKDYEILIFPDVHNGEEYKKTRIIPTGKMGPASKRDLAIKYAKGEILAFIDDDAYPEKNWLVNALKHFEDPNVFAVGGPAITPDEDNFWQKVSGAVFITKLGGGNPERYWPIDGVKEVDDWPSVNLFIRRDIFTKLGGFKSEFWPGEDTKLCLDIVKAGGKIVYDPEVIVYHHRRGSLINHLKQVGNYGLHRGYFIKKYPENSLRIKYFLPSLVVLFIAISMVCLFFNYRFKTVLLFGFVIYGLALLFGFFDICRKEKNILISFFSLFYIFFTHCWYGIRFLEGLLFRKKLISRLREIG